MAQIPLLKQNKSKCNPSEITLRPLTLSDSDVDHFMVWATDEKVTKFCTWDTFTSKESAIIYIQNAIVPHPWFRAICLAGRPIGYMLFTENKGNDMCRGEVGYGLGSEYWGRGIVTQVVKMVAKSVFKECPHLERLEAYVDVDNGGSQRVLEKVGFQREGVLRKYFMLKGKVTDMVIFSLLSIDDIQQVVNN